MDYLQSSLPREELLDLYQDESRGKYVCRAVLQRLPQASQQVVVRLSCCGGTFPKNLVHIWVSKYCQRFLNELAAWSIIVDAEADTVTLTPEFYRGLKDSLQSLDSSPWKALTTDQMAFLEQEASKLAEKGDISFPYMTSDDLERYTQVCKQSIPF